MKKRLTAILTASVLVFTVPVFADNTEPYVTASAKESGLCKTTADQSYKSGKWTTYAGCDPFVLGGQRSLFFTQLRLECTKRPRYVKIRIARITPTGLDTTGTNTYVLGKQAPLSWSGTTWWELKTKHPIVAQFKVVGGKCVSSERQFKWWTP